MDPATLASAVTAFLIPKLAEFGVNFLEDAGKTLWESIVERLKDRPAGSASAGDFSQAADDPDNQEAFAVQLRKLLKEDPEFAEELKRLLEDAEKSSAAGQAGIVADHGSATIGTVNIGSSSDGIMIAGSGNRVSQSRKLAGGKSADKARKKR